MLEEMKARLDRGQPVLRADGGRRRRNAVARRVRRHPRRRLERGRGSRERRALRPRALRTARRSSSPGNLYNLTEGALWGTLPEEHAAEHARRPRRQRHGGLRRGAAGRAVPPRGRRGVRQATRASSPTRREAWAADRIRRFHGPRRDGADDERVLRPVEGVALRARRRLRRRSRSTSSRGSPTSTTSSPASRSSTTASSAGWPRSIRRRPSRPGASSTDLRAFVEDLYSREQGGERFTPEQAEVLGTEAQERATAIAGQVSQAAAELGVTIEQ